VGVGHILDEEVQHQRQRAKAGLSQPHQEGRLEEGPEVQVDDRSTDAALQHEGCFDVALVGLHSVSLGHRWHHILLYAGTVADARERADP